MLHLTLLTAASFIGSSGDLRQLKASLGVVEDESPLLQSITVSIHELKYRTTFS
jgi:hypothetical protein